MLPITEFRSCTTPFDEFDSLSYHQTHYAKTHVTESLESVLEDQAVALSLAVALSPVHRARTATAMADRVHVANIAVIGSLIREGR